MDENYLNKRNCRIWGTENPKMIIEEPLYPQRVTIWCGFWPGGIIGPYFFENQPGAALSVNGLRYRTMINEFLWTELEDMNVAKFISNKTALRATQVAKLLRDSCRYRRNRAPNVRKCNEKFHEKSIVLQT